MSDPQPGSKPVYVWSRLTDLIAHTTHVRECTGPDPAFCCPLVVSPPTVKAHLLQLSLSLSLTHTVSHSHTGSLHVGATAGASGARSPNALAYMHCLPPVFTCHVIKAVPLSLTLSKGSPGLLCCSSSAS